MYNGAKHDVEDILASIRTSIADRSPGYGLDRRDMHVRATRSRSAVAEESMEFELPAIFKTAAEPRPAERPNLLGRLSEALSSNSQEEWDRSSRTVIPFGPAHGRMIEPPPEPRREPAARKSDRGAPRRQDIQRIMPTFYDQRLSRMGEMTHASEVVIEEPEEAVVTEAVVTTEAAHPPRLPEISSGMHAGGVEDAAAQLLRPILKQWLTENMPKIVEKALRSEGGD
jgi:cell pole-organizing protein PopZ